MDKMKARVDRFNKKLASLSIPPPAIVAAVTPNCELCGVPGHMPAECQLLVGTDHANYAQGNQYGQRNPNFAYKNSNPTFAPSPAPSGPPGFQV